MSTPQRIRIGLLFQHNENWIGGTYYILNLMHALRTLPASEQPDIYILSKSARDFDNAQEQTKYPHLQFFPTEVVPNMPQRVLNKLLRPFVKRNIFEKRPQEHQLDVIFPLRSTNLYEVQLVKHLLFWIPDFQEEYLPHFFSAEELEDRRSNRQWIANNAKYLVLSSQSAADDFQKWYPDAKVKVQVVPFAVTHPSYQDLDVPQLLQKYNLTAPYFFCPNQFWIHKNHQVVLDAILLLKKQGHKITLAFSGKEHDYRAPEYTNQLKAFVEQHQLQANIHFLGFIDRAEQLCLMKNALAIVQPSLFEGWSTSVEDAKAMNQPVIASNLAVHIEQLGEKGHYFAPDNAQALADLLLQFQQQPKQVLGLDYTTSVQQFGRSFINVIKMQLGKK